MRRTAVCLVVALMVGVTPVVWAQEQKEEESHVFTVSTYKVQFHNIDRILESWEKTWKPIYTKNEHVKSVRVFTHFWGSDWSIMMITEYESFSAIEDGLKRGEEIRKEMFPDDEQWQATLTELQKMGLGHTDDIVTEVPSLRK
jgi:hypothetical protein